MKRFSDIPSVVHAWAHQTYESCETYNSNVQYEGPLIFSYGRHFPMGRLLGNDKVLLTTRSYSTSTSNHKSQAQQAVFHMERHYCDNPENPLGRDAIFQTLVNIKAEIYCAARRRSPDLRNADVIRAQHMYDEIEWIRKWERSHRKAVEGMWGWAKWSQLPAALKKEWRETKALIEQAKEDAKGALESISAAQLKAERLRLVRKQKADRLATSQARAALEVWQRTGGKIAGFHQIKRLLGSDGLRLNVITDQEGLAQVQTTQGLSVPADDCRKAWPLIKAAYARLDKTGIHVDFDDRAKARHRLGGFYAFTGILRDGRLIVGCHAFTRESVENLAKALGLE